jgi:putative Mg2+ transporter-C (MgtC) family protein
MELTDAFIRIVFAFFAGALVGLERELRDKSAGFRTLILISVGSALFTILAFTITDHTPNTDPTRIISYIVSGIGFLGAGAILKDGANIKGLTTAATVWLTAGLGIGAGAGEFTITAFALFAVMIALVFLPALEHRIDRFHENRHYEIELADPKHANEIVAIFHNHDLKVFSLKKTKINGSLVIVLEVDGEVDSHHKVADELIASKNVINFSV